MAKGEPEDSCDDRISLAKSFALLVVENHHEVDDEIIELLKGKFSEAEISELLAFICFITASQMFGAVLNLKE